MNKKGFCFSVQENGRKINFIWKIESKKVRQPFCFCKTVSHTGIWHLQRSFSKVNAFVARFLPPYSALGSAGPEFDSHRFEVISDALWFSFPPRILSFQKINK
jgi:hypothetical protein